MVHVRVHSKQDFLWWFCFCVSNAGTLSTFHHTHTKLRICIGSEEVNQMPERSASEDERPWCVKNRGAQFPYSHCVNNYVSDRIENTIPHFATHKLYHTKKIRLFFPLALLQRREKRIRRRRRKRINIFSNNPTFIRLFIHVFNVAFYIRFVDGWK